MENIIKKSIEGGYDKNRQVEPMDTGYANCAKIVLDPLFWQALGKACKWEWFCKDCGSKQKSQEKGHAFCETCGLNTVWKRGWFWYGKTFHEKNLTEGFDKAVAWLEDLIK